MVCNFRLTPRVRIMAWVDNTMLPSLDLTTNLEDQMNKTIQVQYQDLNCPQDMYAKDVVTQVITLKSVPQTTINSSILIMEKVCQNLTSGKSMVSILMSLNKTVIKCSNLS